MNRMKQRRVVVTGMGVVAPNGIGKEAFWQATRRGISGITPLPFSSAKETRAIQVAGSVQNFEPEQYLERKQVSRTDRMTHLAFAAIEEALADARMVPQDLPSQRMGIVLANTMGGADYVLKQLHALYTRGPRFMSAYTAIAWLHVANVGAAAIHYGIQGYCKTPVNDTAGGLDALCMAYSALKRGAADVIIAGGCEAFLHPFILHILAQQGHYLTADDPYGYRPFDRRAAGLVLAEGAGVCILEDYEHARQRGAPIYGEIFGYAQTNDAHGFSAPLADGTRYARAFELAMQEGNVQAQDIAYISLDGRAHAPSDTGEVDALHKVFDHPHVLPVSVPRTAFGHSYAAAGALDTITALLALQHSIIPPTLHCDELLPEYSLDLVRDRPRELHGEGLTRETVLVGGRAVGGANVVLALRKTPKVAETNGT